MTFKKFQKVTRNNRKFKPVLIKVLIKVALQPL